MFFNIFRNSYKTVNTLRKLCSPCTLLTLHDANISGEHLYTFNFRVNRRMKSYFSPEHSCFCKLHSLDVVSPWGQRLYATEISQNCWKCGHEICSEKEQYFCECGVLQPPIPERNYFEVLGVETRFDLDPATLTRRFRQLQQKLHPDKVAQKSQTEIDYAGEQSSLVNLAYQVLRKPLSRAEYMLSLHGYNIEEAQTELDPDFLMEIMELNEELANTDTMEDLQHVGEKNQLILDTLVLELVGEFSKGDMIAAMKTLKTLKYYGNIHDKVKELEQHYVGTT